MVIPYLLQSQVVVRNEGLTVNNNITGTWEGVNIPRSAWTSLFFLNNSVTSVNSAGYLLQAGDEVPLSTNNNLDGAVITGNKLTWNGSDAASITHGMFVGYNINYTIKYNYLDKVPYGILFKSGTDGGTNMTYSQGYGASYNIVKNAKLSLRMKGINGVQVYNNTFYSNQKSGSVILIDANHDRTNPSPSTGAKIKNNIFYTVNQISNITIENGCLANFESDYNVFYCETGTPMFNVNGSPKTFSQWQALGYDQHSVVVNPNFINTTGFVPANRLDYGTDLGSTWQAGLSTSASWNPGSAPATTNQNGKWQAGAVIHPAPVATAPLPVFVSSTVENSSPSVVEMIYNLTLANIVPQTSAFKVTVNSSVRNINSVAVSGTKVLLTLASPVVYADILTVSYTKPSGNPLQTAAGGQAVSVSNQTVVNKVAYVAPPPAASPPPAVNAPPVIVLNFPSENLSGFVGELDATASYDPNNDKLTYEWTTNTNVSVSSSNSSRIRFLSPVVSTVQTIQFTLKVSDGKSSQIKTVPVRIVPYRTDLDFAEVINIEASSFQSPHQPYNILDGNIGTMWAANGKEEWIIMELKEAFNIQHVKIAFQPGQKTESFFDVYGSADKETWEPILTKSSSCGFSGDLHVFDFPASKAQVDFRFIKLVGHSNSANSWNYISEFKVFGSRQKNPANYEDLPVKLYPNPAQESVNIRIDDPSVTPDFIRILNMTGQVLYEEKMDPGIKNLLVPLNLRSGTYILQMGSGGLTLFTQKLIVKI